MHARDNAGLLSAFDPETRRWMTEQAKVCYMNVDRTLATWTRTSLSLLVLGVIVDRYGVLVTAPRPHPGTPLAPDPLYSMGGIALVALGTLMALATLIRQQAYRRRWAREFGGFDGFSPWLAAALAAGVVVAGIGLMIALLLFRH